MKLKIREIVAMREAIIAMSSMQLPVLTAFKIEEVDQLITPVFSRFEKVRTSKAAQLGVFDKEKNVYTFDGDNASKFIQDMDTLSNREMELDFPTFKTAELIGDVPAKNVIAPVHLMAIAPLLEDRVVKTVEGLNDVFGELPTSESDPSDKDTPHNTEG